MNARNEASSYDTSIKTDSDVINFSPKFWRNKPRVFLKQRSTNWLSRMSGKNQIDSLVLQLAKNFFGRLTDLHEFLQSLFNVRFRGRIVLVDEIPLFQLVPSTGSDLDLLCEIGQVKHVGKWLRNDDGVSRVQTGYQISKLLEFFRIILGFIPCRKFMYFLDLCRKKLSIIVQQVEPPVIFPVPIILLNFNHSL